MSRKTILIILAIIILGLGAWVFMLSNKSPSADGTPDEKGIFSSLFPFGWGSGTTPDGSNDGTTPDDGTPAPIDETPGALPRLMQIVNNPTAGFFVVVPPPPAKTVKKVVVATASMTTEPVLPVYPTVRYVESGTGYVYEVGAKGGTPTKLSGTVIARTSEALFGDNGQSIVFRFAKTDNKTIATYIGRVVPSADKVTTGSLEGKFLTDGITDIVMAPDGKSFLYLLSTDTGSVGKTIKTDGLGEKQLFSSPFSEWLLDWSALGTVLTTKAAASAPGYAYSLGSSGVMTKLTGGQNGLTTKMSPDGKSMLYSVTMGTGISLHIKRLKDGLDVNTGLATLAEKCAWAADSTKAYCGATSGLDAAASYPDLWYQGIGHFDDALWVIDVATGSTTQLTDGEGNYLDVTKVALDSKGRFIIFINKNNGSVWSYDLDPEPMVPAPATPASGLPVVQ